MNRFWWAVCCGLMSLAASGCAEQGASSAESVENPHPRPVTAFVLQDWDPVESDLVSGTAASWKTEGIGFEVSGRVNFVVEPETDIDGQIYDAQGKQLMAGTELARLDSERYIIRREGAQAQVDVAEQQKQAAKIEADKVIPAKIRAARARQDQLKNEFDRVKRLYEQKVATKEQYDVAIANADSATAEVEQLLASQEAKNAEVKALDAAIKQAEQALAEAKRDLDDCILKAPFPGQIAQVHVIPGANVNSGNAVVTVQMMTPMKVEFEVSRQAAMQLNYNERIDIRIPSSTGKPEKSEGLVYLTDTTADPLTRTYTVTLMVQNRRIGGEVPVELQDQPVWRTRMLWPLRRFAKLAQGNLAVDENAIHRDEQGAFVWKVENRTSKQTGPNQSNVLQVVRQPVQLGQQKIPFLGLYTFQVVRLPDGAQFNPAENLVLGKLIPPQEGATFQGSRVLLDQSRWMIQPGDMIGVQLRRRGLSPGLYVPLDAIDQRDGRYVVFLISVEGNNKTAKQVEVEFDPQEAAGTLRRITPKPADAFKSGDRLIASGVHFLVDGERVEVTEDVKVRR